VRDVEGSFALVAERAGVVVGHVQMSRAWIGDRDVLALGPIGVEPARQGDGIGSALIHATLEEAARRGEVAVVLLGSPEFYPRFGFRPGTEFGLKNPFVGAQEDGFVVAEEDFMLVAVGGGTERLSGEVKWHAAFGPSTV
jgi:putative acetyltransferase